jgi:predicted Zn finger-like uncharacterized protein
MPTPSDASKESNEFIGVTACDYCQSRFRVRPQLARLEGKPIRCPKCHREFVIKIVKPSLVEQAAIASGAGSNDKETSQETSHDATATRRRRTPKAEMKDRHCRRIKKEFRAFHRRLTAIANQENSAEEEVRRWCVDVLKAALGYEDHEIDTEMSALNQRIDIALKDNDKVFMVIECKNIRSRLQNQVRDQSVMYAVNKSSDWAVVTNGQIWKLYRVIPTKGTDPRVVEVFDLALLDEDGVSDGDIELLYLLTKRAIRSGEAERHFHRVCCLSAENLVKGISSERVVRALRKELLETYVKRTGTRVRLEPEEVMDAVKELLVPDNL